MPGNFPLKNVFMKGRPKHEKYDPFWIRHPPMPAGRRAKLFAPFAALKGYDEEVASKQIVYEDRSAMEKEDPESLERKLAVLHGLTHSGRMAKENRVFVTVTFYEPCADENSEAFGLLGRDRTVSGICWNVDKEVSRTITVDSQRIRFDNILRIENDEGIFERGRTGC